MEKPTDSGKTQTVTTAVPMLLNLTTTIIIANTHDVLTTGARPSPENVTPRGDNTSKGHIYFLIRHTTSEYLAYLLYFL